MEPLTEIALHAVSLVSPALTQAEAEDSPEALAAALAAARLVEERLSVKLAGRVDESTISAVKESARVSLGW